MRLAFSSGYNHTAALSPWEQYILCPFRQASVGQLLSLRIGGREARTGWVEDFLAGTGESRLKGKRDYNKEVCTVDAISNSTGHK